MTCNITTTACICRSGCNRFVTNRASSISSNNKIIFQSEWVVGVAKVIQCWTTHNFSWERTGNRFITCYGFCILFIYNHNCEPVDNMNTIFPVVSNYLLTRLRLKEVSDSIWTHFNVSQAWNSTFAVTTFIISPNHIHKLKQHRVCLTKHNWQETSRRRWLSICKQL